ncbi:MAG: purine-nucleoside phosphorylase, partial [Planctomycetes bacterium]|nr:purine-nucleoside phosphorylase [Planctomycetota bacterium]
MLRKMGADLVGMSTVPEALAARKAGMKVLAFSLVTNLAAGISGKKLNHDEVLETGKKSQKRMVQMVRAAIDSID